MLAEHKLDLPAQSIETADPARKAVLEKAFAQVGFIPNMYALMVNSPGLLNTYLDGYAAFRKDSGFTGPSRRRSSWSSAGKTDANTAWAPTP